MVMQRETVNIDLELRNLSTESTVNRALVPSRAMQGPKICALVVSFFYLLVINETYVFTLAKLPLTRNDCIFLFSHLASHMSSSFIFLCLVLRIVTRMFSSADKFVIACYVLQ